MNLLHDKHFTLPASTLIHLLHDTRERTLALFEDLDEAQWEVPYVEMINPFRWELGHARFSMRFHPTAAGRSPTLSWQAPITSKIRSRSISRPLVVASAVATTDSGVYPAGAGGVR